MTSPLWSRQQGTRLPSARTPICFSNALQKTSRFPLLPSFLSFPSLISSLFLLTFAEAFAKAQLGSNSTMKKHGRALLSVREGDKERVVDLAAKLLKQGFELDATHGTAIVLGEAGINPRLVNKVHEGRPHIQDRIKNGEYTYIINTTSGRRAIEDSRVIRRSALQYKVHYDTTLNGGFATAMALNADATEKVISVQEMHAQIK